MKILVAIPHFFGHDKQKRYGSTASPPERRAFALRQCIAGLLTTFGGRHVMVDGRNRQLQPTNTSLAAEMKIVVCTTGAQHLMSRIGDLPIEHEATNSEPKLLGYECHRVLRDNLGRFDYYCFMEDDLLITDSLFFLKLKWFVSHLGPEYLLQPNRFEQQISGRPYRLYPDGNIVERYRSGVRLRREPKGKDISVRIFDQDMTFSQVENSHSGCFFLDRTQMATWAEKSYFLDRATDFVGPLESAATLGIMKTFHVYKPARENAAFLELVHLDHRYIDMLARMSADAAGRPKPPAMVGAGEPT